MHPMKLREAGLKPYVLLILILVIVVAARRHTVERHSAAGLPNPREYLSQHCDGLWQTQKSLIDPNLAAYRANKLLVRDLLNLQGRTQKPQVIVVNNVISTFGTPANNTRIALIPLLVKLSTAVRLPNLVVASHTQDEPEDDVLRGGGPWFGYCNHLMTTTNILYPAGTLVKNKMTCGDDCVAFSKQDTRQATALFLGSSTGWLNGRRRAAVLAGLRHGDQIHSGYTSLLDISQETRDSNDPALRQNKPAMTMQEQVKRYKYIINADGNCAAHRLRHLLASDSVVFWMESNEVEWFYALLQPYVHYVPIRFDTSDPAVTADDILLKLQWAEENPAKIAAIVTNANEVALLHTSEHGSMCYSVQLFNEYSKLFSDSASLHQLADDGFFAQAQTHTESFLENLLEG